MAAQIIFNQTGLSAGTPGARTDGLDDGAQVTITNGSGEPCVCQLWWCPPEDGTAESTFGQVNDTTWSFDPEPACYGTYTVAMYEKKGTPDETVDVRVFGVRTPSKGLLIPGLNERGDPQVTLFSSTAEKAAATAASYNNEPYLGLTYLAWWKAQRDIIMAVETGGGGGGNVTSTEGQIPVGTVTPDTVAGDAKFTADLSGTEAVAQLGTTGTTTAEFRAAGTSAYLSACDASGDLVASLSHSGGVAYLRSVTGVPLALQAQNGDALLWPTDDGTAGQVLKTDGAGNLGWVTVGGSVTSAQYQIPTGTATANQVAGASWLMAASIASVATHVLGGTGLSAEYQALGATSAFKLHSAAGVPKAALTQDGTNATLSALLPLRFQSNSGQIFTWPTSDGTAGQAMVTNGSGVLGWASVISAAGTPTIGATLVYNGTAWVFMGIKTGVDLTNADQTLVVTDGSRRVLPSVPLTANRTKTLSTTGAIAGDVLVIERYDTAAFTVAVVNGGAGAGTKYTFPVSVKRSASFKFDGTNWEFQGSMLLDGG